MLRNPLTAALFAGLLGVTSQVSAVNLSPNGLGQVLIYPYYTVNADQQTLLSVVNTTNVGKVVRVRFLEGYNGRDVLDFNLYLSRHDVWTATVFSLGDLPGGAGGDTSFAAIFTTDNSCTDPMALTASGTFSNSASGVSQGYQQFLDYDYTGSNADTGPTSADRTREGHVEIILMNDVIPGSELDADITHVNGVPADCVSSDLERATGYAPPTLDPVTGEATTRADGGLFGSASIVEVAKGTFYSYNADALEGFTYVSLYTSPGTPEPALNSVNDRGNPLAATAHVFANGDELSATFPSPAQGSRAIDAVSALFTANNVLNEYVTAANEAIGTDWVVTFPTRRFYVDAQPGGWLPPGSSTAYAPFEELFGQVTPGGSCVVVGTVSYDREEASATQTCSFCPCAPGGHPVICLNTNVIRFQDESILGTIRVVASQDISQYGNSGWLNVDLASSGSALSDSGLDGLGHALYPATNGNVFHGLPVAGFAATRFTNGSVPLPGGGNALANYTAANRHRVTTTCVNTTGGGPCS